jgi:tetratricopeptide (TPR) repeat protein
MTRLPFPSAFAATLLLAGLALNPLRAPLSAQADPAAQLAAARAAWERHPEDADSVIWYGRRIGYTGAFQEAVDIYTAGLRLHPNEPRLLRHRGHRYISLRRFPWAIADLELARAVVAGAADEVEPDGQPNARGIPTSSLHSNIRYHLALAYYVTGDFARAEPIWADDVRLAANVDSRVASTYWWVLTLAQLQRHAEAKAVLATVVPEWDVIENGSYHRALLWMRGVMPEAQLFPSGASVLERQTIGNGMGQWHAANGRLPEARQAWAGVLATGPSASFGYIAAEQAMSRLTNP